MEEIEKKLEEIVDQLKTADTRPATTIVYPEGVGHSSVEFEKMQKGFKFKMKIYSNDLGGAHEALNKAKELLPELIKLTDNGKPEEKPKNDKIIIDEPTTSSSPEDKQ